MLFFRLEFKVLFGDWEKDRENASKVVDDQGRPLVVRYTTHDEFTVFDKNESSRWTDFNASDEKYAKTAYVGFGSILASKE